MSDISNVNGTKNPESEVQIGATTTNSKSVSVIPIGFIQRIIDFVSGTDREERIKNRLLKGIRIELGQLKHKFYSHKKNQIMPPFGYYFYDIYRMCQNFSKFFDIKNHANTIKLFLFDSLLTKKQMEIRNKLEKEYIENMMRSDSDTQKSINEVRATLNEFVKSFDQELVRKINTTFNQIVDLSSVINYDWFYLLRKFDSGIAKDDFGYKPSFEVLEGKYIIDDLIAINDYIETLNFNNDWKYVIEYINLVSEDKGLLDIFKKLVNNLRIIKKDQYLTKIIQIITRDPHFKPKEFLSKAKIVQDYIHSYQIEIQGIVQNAIKVINREKTNKLLMEIFNTTAIVRMKFYTQKLDDMLTGRGVQTRFKFIEPMNYIKAFLLDIGKGEIKSRIDVLIIKGTWDTNMHSSEYSLILDDFTKLADKVLDFDARCSEEDGYGKELRRLISAVKHDPKAKIMLVKLIDKINEIANRIIHEGIVLFTRSANLIQTLLEDHNLKNPKIVINIHKIKWEFSKSFRADMFDLYKKLANMVILLKNYAEPIEEIPKEL